VPSVKEGQSHAHNMSPDTTRRMPIFPREHQVLTRELRPGNVAAAEEGRIAPQALSAHHGIASCLVKALLNVLKHSNVSVGNNGDAEMRFDFADDIPVSGGALLAFVLASATVNAKHRSSSVLDHLCILRRSASVGTHQLGDADESDTGHQMKDSECLQQVATQTLLAALDLQSAVIIVKHPDFNGDGHTALLSNR